VKAGRQRGFTFIEVMVYTIVVAVVFSMGLHSYVKSQQFSGALTLAARQTMMIIQAGERWRNDIRLAVEDPVVEDGVFCIVQPSNVVKYRFYGGCVERFLEGELDWCVILYNVAASEMSRQDRNHTTCWIWELEVEKNREQKHPAFYTFMAVNKKGGEN